MRTIWCSSAACHQPVTSTSADVTLQELDLTLASLLPDLPVTQSSTDTACISEEIHLAFLRCLRRLLVTAGVVPSSPILVTLMMEALCSCETPVLQEPHAVTSQKAPFFCWGKCTNSYTEGIGKIVKSW
jgi:hypothetical protein